MKVSVIVVTYNHAEYVADALASALGQKTDFDYEIVVNDDCSNDGTQEILRRFEHNHPARIRLILSPVNRNDWSVFSVPFQGCRGDYIALLEGDDFWSSPHKLARQVAFLEEHPHCSACFHNVLILDESCRERPRLHNHCEKLFWELPDILSNCFIQTGSVMFQSRVLRAWPEPATIFSGDWALYVFAAQHGALGYLDEVLSVYRVHTGGMWSGIPKTVQFERIIAFYRLIAPQVPAQSRSLVQEMILKRSFDLSLEYERAGDPARAAMYLGDVIAARPSWAQQYVPGFDTVGWEGLEHRLRLYRNPVAFRRASSLRAKRAAGNPPAPGLLPGQTARTFAANCLGPADHRDCNIEYVNDYSEPLKGYRIMAACGGLLQVKGWAVDQQACAAARGVELVLDGALYQAEYGSPRPDVADYFQVPAFRESGFRVEIPLDYISPGSHEFRIRILLRENGDYLESMPVRFDAVSAAPIRLTRSLEGM